jgi:hypothetical protein
MALCIAVRWESAPALHRPPVYRSTCWARPYPKFCQSNSRAAIIAPRGMQWKPFFTVLTRGSSASRAVDVSYRPIYWIRKVVVKCERHWAKSLNADIRLPFRGGCPCGGSGRLPRSQNLAPRPAQSSPGSRPSISRLKSVLAGGLIPVRLQLPSPSSNLYRERRHWH